MHSWTKYIWSEQFHLFICIHSVNTAEDTFEPDKPSTHEDGNAAQKCEDDYDMNKEITGVLNHKGSVTKSAWL